MRRVGLVLSEEEVKKPEQKPAPVKSETKPESDKKKKPASDKK
mgnify:CR=1 FL=1